MKKYLSIGLISILVLSCIVSFYLFQKNLSNKNHVDGLSNQLAILQAENESLSMEAEKNHVGELSSQLAILQAENESLSMKAERKHLLEDLWRTDSTAFDGESYEIKRVDEEKQLLLRYSYYKNNIDKAQIIYKDGSYLELPQIQLSRPEISPNKEKIAYIAEFAWEIMGDIYIYDFQSETSEKYVIENIPFQTCPSQLVWLDDTYLLSVVKTPYGTIAEGGNVYALNTKDGSSFMILEGKARPEDPDVGFVEICDIKMWGDSFKLSPRLLDKNSDNSRYTTQQLFTREEIEELIHTKTTQIIKY